MNNLTKNRNNEIYVYGRYIDLFKISDKTEILVQ